MAPILSHGQTTNGQCGFNHAASRPADPIKRHRARRERRHPKAMLATQTCAVALDLLENKIGAPGHLGGLSEYPLSTHCGNSTLPELRENLQKVPRAE